MWKNGRMIERENKDLNDIGFPYVWFMKNYPIKKAVL